MVPNGLTRDRGAIRVSPLRLLRLCALLAGLGPVIRLAAGLSGHELPFWLSYLLDGVTLIACGIAFSAAWTVRHAIVHVGRTLEEAASATLPHTVAPPPAPDPRLASDPLARLLDRATSARRRFDETAAELRRLRDVDPLTGLGNRAWLRIRGGEEIVRAAREKKPLSLVLVRIDHLDAINERHGFDAGDAALMSVADTLREFVRPYDLVGRVAGDTFCVVLPGTGGIEADRVMRRLDVAIQRRQLILLGDKPVKARFRIIERQATDTLFERLLARGQEALAS